MEKFNRSRRTETRETNRRKSDTRDWKLEVLFSRSCPERSGCSICSLPRPVGVSPVIGLRPRRQIHGRDTRATPVVMVSRRYKPAWGPSSFILSAFARFVEQSPQFQEAVNQQTKPEIDQGSEVKLVRVMLGSLGQIGIKGEIQAIAKQNRNQILEPLHRYRFHLCHPA